MSPPGSGATVVNGSSSRVAAAATVRRMLDPTGPVVLVTGAAGDGIGRATVEEFLARGARVALTDRSGNRTANAVAELYERYGPEQVRGWVMDVADRPRAKVV